MQGVQIRFFRWTGGRYGILLGSLLLVLLASPFVRRDSLGRAILDILVAATMLSSLVATMDRRWILRIGLLLAVPALVVQWISTGLGSGQLALAGLGMSSLFLGYVAAAILAAILRETDVSVDTICGSLCVYLLLAVLFAEAFDAIRLNSPDAFNLPADVHVRETLEVETRQLQTFLYFSFVTLTTLGYGDIRPISPIARTLAVLEAVLGQIYLTILVARLVGMHIARPTSEPPT